MAITEGADTSWGWLGSPLGRGPADVFSGESIPFDAIEQNGM
jgi:hypothetical protein